MVFQLRFETKKRIVFAALMLVVVWPLVHHGLVRRYEINPWKFFGWSMYCIQPGRLELLFFPVADGGESPKWYAGQPAELTDAIGEYLNRRRVWGLLLPPDEVASAVFDHAPRLNKVRLEVSETVMDTRTSRLGQRTHQYFYAMDRTRDVLQRYAGPKAE